MFFFLSFYNAGYYSFCFSEMSGANAKHKKNVGRCSGTLETSPHSRVFDTTYIFVVGDWFRAEHMAGTSVSSSNAKALGGFFLQIMEA